MQLLKEFWPVIVSISGVVTVIGAIREFLKGGETPWVDAAKGAWRILYWLTIPLHSPWTLMLAKKDDARKLNELVSRSKQRDADIEKIQRALYNGGANGLLHQVGVAMARTGDTIEATNCPMFECDGQGSNVTCNYAYRKLVGATMLSELTGQRWKNVIHGELAQQYVDAFNEASAMRSDFIGEVDFQNPWTREHVGRWLIHARVTVMADGSLYYVGRFISPVDDAAKGLASANEWNVG